MWEQVTGVQAAVVIRSPGKGVMGRERIGTQQPTLQTKRAKTGRQQLKL